MAVSGRLYPCGESNVSTAGARWVRGGPFGKLSVSNALGRRRELNPAAAQSSANHGAMTMRSSVAAHADRTLDSGAAHVSEC